MKRSLFLFLLLIAGSFFLFEKPGFALESYIIETDESSASESLDRVAGPDHNGFSTSSQSYDSDSHSSSAGPSGISF